MSKSWVSKTGVELRNITVIKRDGRESEFDASKIYDALRKASDEIQEYTPEVGKRLSDIVENVFNEISDRFSNNVKIYEIQNIVEHVLVEKGEADLLEKYVTYRLQRDMLRARGKLENK